VLLCRQQARLVRGRLRQGARHDLRISILQSSPRCVSIYLTEANSLKRRATMIPSDKDNEIAMLERRREQRRSVFLDGKIDFNRRQFHLGCLVQNVSFSGAKLVLRNAANIPAEFSLIISSQEHSIFRARTKWRQRNTIGVEIIHPHMANSLDGSHRPRQETASADVCVAA
jgi:PilZ domain-containing protein